MPKGVIGENWKGIGNSYVDDQPGYAVDCLNVMASKDGRWLRSRPGFKDTRLRNSDLVTDNTSQVNGLAVYDKIDNNYTLGWALLNGATGPSQIKYNLTANINAYANEILHRDWIEDINYSRTFQYGGIDGVSFLDSMSVFGRAWSWQSLWSQEAMYYGRSSSSSLTVHMPLMTSQGWRSTTIEGLYGADNMFGVPTLSNLSSGNMTASSTYYLSWQFVTKDINGRVVAYSTPSFDTNSASTTLASGQTGVQLTLPYRMDSFNMQLGWTVSGSAGTITVNRGWMCPTHVRILRTPAGISDYYFIAEEYPVGYMDPLLWRDDTGTYANVHSLPVDADPGNVYYDNNYENWDFKTNKMTKAADWASFLASETSWIYDSGRLWVKDAYYANNVYFKEAGKIVLVTTMADEDLVVEYEDLRGCPSMCWLGVNHNNRLFAFASDLRTAWNGKADIWYSLSGNYSIFGATNYLQIGDGDIPTSALSINGTDSLFILTDKNAYILTGNSPETYSIYKVGSNCGCFSYKGAAKHGNRIVWFGDRELWASEGGSPVSITPLLLPKHLKSIDSTASTSSGFGCYYNGQLWYRKTAYTTADATKKGFVYDFDQNTVWPVDRTIEAVRDVAGTTARYRKGGGSSEWSEKAINDNNDMAFCLYRRTSTDAPVSIGQFKLTDHAKNEYNHYDQTCVITSPTSTTWTDVAMTRYWISPWYSMGQTNDKKIDKVRIVASPETKVNLTVEGNRDWTENTTKVPNARTVQLSGGTSEWMKLPVEVRGRYIRFRLEGVGTEKFDVKNIEFDYEVIA
jgi:hypothetical protein